MLGPIARGIKLRLRSIVGRHETPTHDGDVCRSDVDCLAVLAVAGEIRDVARVMGAVFAMSETSPVYLGLRKDCGIAVNRRQGPMH
jgi:hypothetical protein